MSDTRSAAGMQFPLGEDGRRSSLGVNRDIWADAVAEVDPALSQRIRDNDSWRKDYVGLVKEVTEAGGRSSQDAVRIAEAGLDAARRHLTYVRDGQDLPVGTATTQPPSRTLETETVRGTAQPVDGLAIPYLGQDLRGDALRRRLAAWVAAGVIEPSAATALNAVIDNPDWLRLEGHRVVVLGAGAQTSPLPVLTSWGVEALALDLPREALWRKVIGSTQRRAGTVHLPVRPGPGDAATRAGADLIAEVPEILTWLSHYTDKPLVFGFYVYADGPLHVQATLAADAILQALTGAGHDVVPAFAGTPTDCYLVPEDVVEDSNSRRRRRRSRALDLAVRGVSAGHLYRPAYDGLLSSQDGLQVGVADAIVTQQGPNYALAKRLQRWRSIAAWDKGTPASFNVAPPAWTVSVTKNRLMAAGYHGAHFAGLEVFSPETMRALMTALMVHDLHVPQPAAHPELRVSADAVHGGYWRVPHDIRSTLLLTAALGLPKAFSPAVKAR